MDTIEITVWAVFAAMLLTHYQMRRANNFMIEGRAALRAARELKDESAARFAAADAMLKDVVTMQAGIQADIAHNQQIIDDVRSASRDLMEFNSLWQLGMREEAIELADKAGFTKIDDNGVRGAGASRK